jgi:hypothetical protein
MPGRGGPRHVYGLPRSVADVAQTVGRLLAEC